MGRVNIQLNYTPRRWQRRVHQRLRRFSVLALHRRAGKTMLAIMLLIHKACAHDPAAEKKGVYIYVAPFLKQAKALSWDMLKQQVSPIVAARLAEINETEYSVTFAWNGAKIRLFGADNPDALRGMGIDFVVVDEVADIKPDVWQAILLPCLADREGGALFIGTPKGINLFSKLYFDHQDDPDWFTARFSVYDTDALKPEEIAKHKNPAMMSEAHFAREYLCDFAAGADDQLISLSLVEDAARRVHPDGDILGAGKAMGIDVARFGDDRSVICKRQGLRLDKPLVFRGVNNMDLASRAAQEINSWKPDAVFVDSGAGAGVIDRLRQLGFTIIEVPFGGKAIKDTEFRDRRAEMWFGAREWLEQGGQIPNDMVLKQELATPTYWFDPTGRKVVEPKDEIKKRLPDGASPDTADAFVLTFAAPVAALSPYEEEKRKWEQIRAAQAEDNWELEAARNQLNSDRRAGQIGKGMRRSYDPYENI